MFFWRLIWYDDGDVEDDDDDDDDNDDGDAGDEEDDVNNVDDGNDDDHEERKDAEIYRKKTQSKMSSDPVCEPAQSNHTPTCHKSHPIRKFTRKMPRPRMSPERRHTFCANLRSQNPWQDFTRVALCGNHRWNAAEQNVEAHFARTCAIETHVEISQEPFYAEIRKKTAAHQNLSTDFVRAYALETHVKILLELLYAAVYK